MLKFLQKIFSTSTDKVAGLNSRNIKLVYPHNQRKDFDLADDKLATKAVLEKYSIPHPETYEVIETMGAIDEKWEKLSKIEKLAIKPSRGKTGDGILVLQSDKNSWKTPSGKKYKKSEIHRHLANIVFGIFSFGEGDKAIIEYCIQSHSFFKEIYNSGVPDIRIILLKSTPLMAMLRLPTHKSDGKGNLHQGALGIAIDLDTGTLGKGIYNGNYIDTHPDSGIQFKGMQIPFWDEIMSIAIKTAEHVPLEYLGVDIVIDQHKGPMLIEINARPGIEIQNINELGLFECINMQSEI